MSASWVCWLLPLALVLLLEQPSHGNASFLPPPGLRGLHDFLEKRKETMAHQAIHDLQKVMSHMNKKYNRNYRLAPGKTTHIVMQTASVRAYSFYLVLDKCPENSTADLLIENRQDCKIPPDAPKIECRLDVVILPGVETPYLGEEVCHEYTPPEPSVNLSDGMVDSTYPYVEEEGGTPYL